jgi:hypothetical protein
MSLKGIVALVVEHELVEDRIPVTAAAEWPVREE